eukprot:7881060-Heterocapsa_arctica.AAC.1
MERSTSTSLAKQLIGNNGEEPDRWPSSLVWKISKLTSTVMETLFRLAIMLAGMNNTRIQSVCYGATSKNG